MKVKKDYTKVFGWYKCARCKYVYKLSTVCPSCGGVVLEEVEKKRK